LFDHDIWQALQKIAAVKDQRSLAVFQVYVTPADAAAFIAAVESTE
jgi:hypothetical protein